jgi:hypothetical protein
MTAGLDQFWRCSTCGFGVSLGQPAKFTAPPLCSQHGEMEQCTAEGFAADINRTEEGEQDAA